MKRKSRVDNNQRDIVLALRSCGASVQHLHQVGHGCPDILVGFQGVNYLIEIKGKNGKLTPQQRLWHASWSGSASVVRSISDALGVIGIDLADDKM